MKKTTSGSFRWPAANSSKIHKYGEDWLSYCYGISMIFPLWIRISPAWCDHVKHKILAINAWAPRYISITMIGQTWDVIGPPQTHTSAILIWCDGESLTWHMTTCDVPHSKTWSMDVPAIPPCARKLSRSTQTNLGLKWPLQQICTHEIPPFSLCNVFQTFAFLSLYCCLALGAEFMHVKSSCLDSSVYVAVTMTYWSR